MDFSETFKCSGPTAYSPNGRYLAIAAEYRLFVRDADTLAVVQLYSCLDKIHTVDWSPNSAYVMCGARDARQRCRRQRAGQGQRWSTTPAGIVSLCSSYHWYPLLPSHCAAPAHAPTKPPCVTRTLHRRRPV